MKRTVVLCVLVCIGCGGSSAKTPVQKCDDLITFVCDRGVECIPAAGTHAECVQALQQVLPCGMAKMVTTSYDRCVSQIKADSCTVLFPADPQTGDRTLSLPADCVGVIQMLELTGRPTGSVFDGASWMSRTADPE